MRMSRPEEVEMLEAYIIEELEKRERSTCDMPYAQPTLPVEPPPELGSAEREGTTTGRVIVIEMI